MNASAGSSPASAAISSSTPGRHKGGCAEGAVAGFGMKGRTTAFIASMSQCSGGPHTWATTGAPDLATLPASRSAPTRSAAKKNDVKPVTRSKRSSS